jgi:DNA mismatch repair protein MutL
VNFAPIRPLRTSASGAGGELPAPLRHVEFNPDALADSVSAAASRQSSPRSSERQAPPRPTEQAKRDLEAFYRELGQPVRPDEPVAAVPAAAPVPTEPAPAPLPELPFLHPTPPAPTPAQALTQASSGSHSPRATQVLTRYVLLPVKSGLMLIDQEAARERILYEQYAAGQERGAVHSQALLFPRPLTFSPADFAVLQELTQPLHLLGFRFAEFGPLTIAVEAVPADLPAQGEKQLLESLIEQFRSGAAPLRIDRREALARALARRVAQATSQARLPDIELSALVDKLFACQVPNYTPDGRPTVVLLDGQQLADFFRKPGT